MSSMLPVFEDSAPSGEQLVNGAASSPLDRREFLAQSTLAAVAAVLFAACGTGSDFGNPTAPTNVNVTVTLASYSALGTVGGIVRLSGTSTPIAVVRSGDSSYRAFSMICPHEGSIIGVSGSGFLCPNHKAQFSSSGANVGGQRTSSLFEFTVALNATAGTLTITS